MKTILFILLSVLVLTSCVGEDFSPEEMAQIKQETIDQQEQLRVDQEILKQRDSMINATLKEVKSNLKDSIKIIKCQTTKPSSTVGGVDCKLVWKNTSKRTIKYIDFYVSAINGVGDEVYSEIGRANRPEKLSLTGPIKSNQTHGNGGLYETVWYNSDIKKCKLRSVNIEYMDGSKIDITM